MVVASAELGVVWRLGSVVWGEWDRGCDRFWECDGGLFAERIGFSPSGEWEA